MKRLFILPLMAAALFTSCSVQWQTRTARTASMPVETYTQWTTSELEVSDMRVKATAENTGSRRMALSLKQLKENAMGLALEQANADVLIDPLFTCEYVKGRLVRVTVSGYPAKHVNFRTIKFEDQKELQIEQERVKHTPQIMITGAEVINSVKPEEHVCPAPAGTDSPAVTAPVAPSNKTKRNRK